MMVSTGVEFRLLAMPLIPLSHLGREAEPERKFRLMVTMSCGVRSPGRAASASCIVAFGDSFGPRVPRVTGRACRFSLIW